MKISNSEDLLLLIGHSVSIHLLFEELSINYALGRRYETFTLIVFGGEMTAQTGKIGTNISEELFKYAGLEIRFLLTSSDCNGTMSVFEFSVPASFKIPGPAHRNDGYEEMVYGLEGTLTWTVNEADVDVGPGEALCIPRGAAHRWANNGTVPAKQLTVISPGVMGPEYFREVRQLLSAGGPPNPAAMGETMRRHGMIPVVPAPSA